MLILASVIALLGVTNTTALAINERSGELGCCERSTRLAGELRRIVRLDVAFLSFVAASIGIAVAGGLGWALIDVTGGVAILSVVVTWSRLAVTLVVAVAVGVVAAAWSAFRGLPGARARAGGPGPLMQGARGPSVATMMVT
jgi:putative ABC transport system permease protein